MIEKIIRHVIADKSSDMIRIWYIKEVLQAEVIDFLYRGTYKELLFYGGTAMRFLLGLNRLSEDLDFIGKGFDNFEQLWKDLQDHFLSKGIAIDYKVQKFRITLKFRNFLSQFELSFGASQDLYLKVEISDHFDFCTWYKSKYYPVLYHGKSMIIKSLDEATLCATKINAVLYRQWEKKTPNLALSVKWRDFYDLFWYFQKDIIPNIDCVEGVDSMTALSQKLTTIIQSTSFDDVAKDIRPFVEDATMVEFIQHHGQQYLLEQVARLQK